jgi:hypothetical protein
MYLGEPRKTKENYCPFCNHLSDGLSQVNGENLPNPGDASICIQYGNVSVFSNDLSLRKPLPEEESDIQADHTIREAQRAIFEMHVIIALKNKQGFGYGNA